MQTNRIKLLHWCAWFFLGNALLYWIIGLNYLPSIAWLDTGYLNFHGKSVIHTFAALAYIGHLGLLALLPCVLFVPLLLIFPRRKFIFTLAIICTTIAGFLLVIDVMTYKIYRFHLSGVILDIAVFGLGEKMWEMSNLESFLLISIAIGLVIVESVYAVWLWRSLLNKRIFQVSLKWVLIGLSLSLYTSYLMIIYSGQYAMNRVIIDVSRFLPLYLETFCTVMPIKNGRMLFERISESYLIQPQKMNAPLNYPLQPVQCSAAKRPKNLVIILIDTWRFDQLNQQITPSITEFSKQSWVFNRHFSGGNCTGPGVFSLFYGMPSTYWTAMETQHRGPVLMNELLKQNYQMGIFSSASLKLPPFNQTVFSGIKNLRLTSKGETPYDRDLSITKDFKEFIAKAVHKKEPFFSFLFYDAAHSYCAFKQNLGPLTPAVKHCNRMELTNKINPTAYFNRYKNALMLVDQQVREVFETLKQYQLLDNTVVLITGDHGEEFNDNHQGYWGHASNYTYYQTQTPLIIYWPDRKPQVFDYQTSHFDIAPTLMKEFLGCNTPAQNYSFGKGLLDKQNRSYLIVGSYVGFGVLESDQILSISQSGNFLLQHLDGQPYPEGKIKLATVQDVFQDLRRFYIKN